MKKRNEIKTIKFLALVVLIVMSFALYYIYKHSKYIDSEQEKNSIIIESLENEITIESLREENLKEKIQNYNSNTNIEKVAREEFGFIKNDEIIIKPKKNKEVE